MKFKISPELLSKYPTVCEYIVVAREVNNEIAGKSIVDRMSVVTHEIKEKGKELLNNERYSRWERVYEEMARTASLKPSDFHASHVALTKRAFSGKGLPNINPLVNFYNMYSLKYGVPFGGEDLSTVYGDLILTVSKGGDLYKGIGESIVEKTNAGEVTWKDDYSVTCRLWNWRQSDRTKITRNSKDIYFIIDGFTDLPDVEYEKLVTDFCHEVQTVFGAKVEYGKISAESPEFEVNYVTKSVSGIDAETEMSSKSASGKAKNKNTDKTKKILQRKAAMLGLKDGSHLSERVTAIVDEIIGEHNGGGSSTLSLSQNSPFGDFSTTLALKRASVLKKSPQEIAQEMVQKLVSDPKGQSLFSSVSAAPNGFINLTLLDSVLVDELVSAYRKKDSFGNSEVGENRTILIESPSINPNAAAHIGHLLNLFIGRALGRLFTKVGFDVKVDNLINDRGIKICMAMWGVANLSESSNPTEAGLKPDQFVGLSYVKAKQLYNEDSSVKEEIQQMLRDWEEGKPEVMELWKKVVGWAYEGHRLTFERLDEVEGHLWLESEIYKGGKDVIQSYLGKGVIEKLPDGAVIGRLEEKYGIPDVILLRADGTSLYETQDIYLTMLKVKKFNPWKAIWVVGNEQIAHFQKLFALFEALEILNVDNLYHMGYGIVVDKKGIKIGKNAADATADTVLDQMRDMALSIMKERKIKRTLEDEGDIAEAVGQGALRYAFLSKDPFLGTVYDPESALSFTGRSGPYIMYAYTRAKNVLGKVYKDTAHDEGKEVDSLLSEDISLSPEEKSLALSILQYPEIILSAANAYAPNVVAEYLYKLARQFSNFYEKMPIASAEGNERHLRILLTSLTSTILKDGLSILGIRTLENM